MKTIFVFACLLAVTVSVPLDSGKNAKILRYENDNIGLQGFKFAYETSDGTARQEQGEFKNVGTENEALVVRGIINYVGDDGKPYALSYIADENGFQPQGDHLPRVAAV